MLNPMRKRKDGRANNKTPETYRFRPGQSGNRKGRPKKAPSVLDMVEQELGSKHFIEIAGKRIEVPMRVLLIKQLLRLAMKGNAKALFLALEMLDKIQKTNATRYAQSKVPRISSEDLKGKTQDELTEMYFEALRGVDGIDRRNR